MATFLTFTRSFDTTVQPTERVRDCAAMYGIGIDEKIKVSLYQDLRLCFAPGRVIYLTGESGSGKSCLLRDIKAQVQAHASTRLADFDVATLNDAPLVDQFPDLPLKQGLELLAIVGITEAFVFLRRPSELSDGQRYRFLLATMIHGAMKAKLAGDDRIPVICADEFLAVLDRETAKNVAYQVRKAATGHSLCFVVATTHDDIVRDLRPNTLVRMRLNHPPDLRMNPCVS